MLSSTLVLMCTVDPIEELSVFAVTVLMAVVLFPMLIHTIMKGAPSTQAAWSLWKMSQVCLFGALLALVLCQALKVSDNVWADDFAMTAGELFVIAVFCSTVLWTRYCLRRFVCRHRTR